ncbi:MAG: NAD(+)/NADH kinase [Nitrososphaerales archaeon]
MAISKIGLIAKEAHGEAKQVANDIATLLLSRGFKVTSFPNLRVKGVDHVRAVKDLRSIPIDLYITVSGDGTILRLLRILDSNVPFLCVNVGGRGILAEVKPGQVEKALDKLEKHESYLEKRLRIQTVIGDKELPPALNEVYAIRQEITRTPLFNIEMSKGAVFAQRMDGILICTPTGSTGHSYSYGNPFLDGSLNVFAITPVGPIKRFPTIIKPATEIRLMANYPLRLVIDGQEIFDLEADSYASFRRHARDAVFVRFDTEGPFRQLRNLGFE